jgi:plastocyanin
MKRFRLVPAVLLLAFAAACGQTPDTTQKARGVLSGGNFFLVMTIVLVVVAGAAVVGALALDRFVRTRKRLAETPVAPPEEEETDEVVAGITVGRAGVPKWLYAAYVIIPLFAIGYVFNSVTLAPKPVKKKAHVTAPAGPLTKATVVAQGIKFDVKELDLKASSPVTITIDNKDTGVPHTFTIWKSQADAQNNNNAAKIEDTGPFTDQKVVNVTTPAAGTTWYFNCTIHPTSMFGTIKISSAPAGGGGGGGAPSGPTTTPKVVAKGIKFDVKSLTLKANSTINVSLDNLDTGVPHTFTVWKSQADAQNSNTANQVADTGPFTGTKQFSFKTGPPGTWYFDCTIHPTSMFGTITVQ